MSLNKRSRKILASLSESHSNSVLTSNTKILKDLSNKQPQSTEIDKIKEEKLFESINLDFNKVVNDLFFILCMIRNGPIEFRKICKYWLYIVY